MNHQQAAGTLRAGAAEVDITPQPGIQLAGDIGRPRRVETVADPLFAKALIVESAECRICLLSLDVCVVTELWAKEIRRRAAQQFDLDPAAVMVHALQNHSAPSMGHAAIDDASEIIPTELSWLRGGDDVYSAWAIERILEAIELAHAALEPVEVGAASGIEGRVAFNRRVVLRDGSALTNPPLADPRIRYVEGPVDPELGVVCVRNEASEIIAAVLHHTCHPTYGYPTRSVSADWPGVWSDGIREMCGPGCVPLVINGCCGNILHVDYIDPSYVSDKQRHGRLLTETTAKVMEQVIYSKQAVLDYKSEHLMLPKRQFDAQAVQAARDLLAKHPTPLWLEADPTAVSWDWIYAASLADTYERSLDEPFYDYEVQVFRIGDIAIVGVDGEPFVEAQLRIKLESPAYPTYLAHMSNSCAGYVPTAEALERGGYETRAGNWSKLAPQALDMIVEGTTKLLHEVFSAPAGILTTDEHG